MGGQSPGVVHGATSDNQTHTGESSGSALQVQINDRLDPGQHGEDQENEDDTGAGPGPEQRSAHGPKSFDRGP
jgi:hypothetical protein